MCEVPYFFVFGKYHLIFTTILKILPLLFLPFLEDKAQVWNTAHCKTAKW